MRSFESSFWDRDDPVLSERLDNRIDMLAGLRVSNFAAGANLKMSAPVGELHRWRKSNGRNLGVSASVAAATIDIDRATPASTIPMDINFSMIAPLVDIEGIDISNLWTIARDREAYPTSCIRWRHDWPGT